MTIIGITGTLGAGKGTVVDYLVKKYGFKHYSARVWISEQLKIRGRELTRENMRIVANELRNEHGADYILQKLYDQAVADNKTNGTNAVIESLRNPKEIEALRNKPEQFIMIAVDANPKIRYERILERKSSTDHVSFEKFLKDEQAEMNDPSPGGMKLAECLKMADIVLNNDSDIAALHKQIDQYLKPRLH